MTLPAPYYQDESCTIYCGDSGVIAPQLEAWSVVLTDPPYGVGLSQKRPHGMRKHAGSTYTFGEDTPEYVEDVCVPIIEGLVGTGRRVVLTPGDRNMWRYPEPVTAWAIYFPAGAGKGRWKAFNCWQPVLCYGDGPKRIGCIPDTFVTTESADSNGHPCPKPLMLWKRVLDAVTEDGDVVLDPFAGSGTTLRAAKDLGMRSIGIELEEKFCEIAARRMLQGVLF